MLEALKKSFPVGLACSIVALGYSTFMYLTFEKNWSASISSVVGTLIIGSTLWYWFVQRNRRYSILRGLLIGISIGWLSLYLGVVGAYLADSSFSWSSFKIVLQGVAGAAVFTHIILVVHGWISVVCCGIIGIIFTLFQKE